MSAPPLLFATNAQILDRFDGRWIGMNLLDTGASATVANLLDLTTPNVAATRLQSLIGDASEMLMSAAAVGARYAVADLTTYGGNLVVNITCGLAMGPILKRRSRPVTANKMISDAYNEAMQYIEQLRRGDRIFALVPNVPEAGLAYTSPMAGCVPYGGPDITGVSGRYFGVTPGGCGPCGGPNPYAAWPPPCGPC
jgi:hypothetical protein